MKTKINAKLEECCICGEVMFRGDAVVEIPADPTVKNGVYSVNLDAPPEVAHVYCHAEDEGYGTDQAYL